MVDVVDKSTSTPENFETPGALLRAARKKAGLSPPELAKELNLSVAKLEALENDQYEQLASDVFAQGYLRRYGRLVNVDGNMLVARFNEYRAQERERSEQLGDAEPDSTSVSTAAPKWLLPACIFAAAVVVLAFIFLRSAGDEATGPITQESSAQVESAEAESADVSAQVESTQVDSAREADVQEEADLPRMQPSARASGRAANDSPLEDPPSVANVARNQVEGADPVAEVQVPIAEPAEVKPAEATAEAENQNVQSAETAEDTLSFRFSEDCWVEVSNARGTVIHADLAKAGQSLTVEGEAPFSVMLGNARAVALSYNGNEVAVNPTAGRRTARLTVGE